MLKFSKMSKYGMTGIGLNLKEIPDDNGSFKLVVLGLLLDGPAYSAGVRRVSSIHTQILIETLSAF
jgi:carboxyl-terminal processing protease